MAAVPAPDLRGVERGLWWGLVAIFAGLPFHAFVVTWAGSRLPERSISVGRLWYEAVTLLVVGLAGYLVWHRPALRRIAHEPATLVIAALALLHLLIWAVVGASATNGLLALKVNIGFLAVFLAARVLALSQPQFNLAERSLPLILIPAAAVTVFGLAQLAAGQHDLLRWFGYDPNRPYQFVVGHSLRRLTSTLWGPNQFGSYLVLPLMLTLWLALYRQRRWAIGLGAGLLVMLYGTQSRGAWVAAAVGAFGLLWLRLRHWRWRVGLAGGAALLAAATLALSLHHSTIIVHNDVTNVGHLQEITKGFDRLQAHPLGAGLAAAGRASETTDQKLYTENFYLQVAVQVGWEGLVLFGAVVALVIYALWQTSATNSLALPVLAALVGLSLNNLVAHTWSDAATALLLWGMAGLILTRPGGATSHATA